MPPALRAGVTHLIYIVGATSTALRSPPDCPAGVLTRPAGGSHSSYLYRWCDLHCVAVATRLPLGRPYPPKGRPSLILFKSWVRPPLRCGRHRTALRASLPALWAGSYSSYFDCTRYANIDATSTALRSPHCPTGVLFK